MTTLFDQFALLTRLLGVPLSARALAGQVQRNDAGRIDLASLGEVLRSHGFENRLSERALAEIPAAAVPLLVLTQDGAGRVVSRISSDASGARRYEITDADGTRRECTEGEVAAHYAGHCWLVKARPERDARSELPEYTMGKGWFWRVMWRYKGYYAQVVVASLVVNVLALIGSLYVMNVYDRVIPNRAYETLWVLSLGVIAAALFEFLARTLRARLTDIAGKKADLVISSALFRRLLAMDMAEKPVSSGSYANNLRDFESVRDFMTSASLLTLVDLPFILLFIGIMWLVAGPLALVPLLTIPLVLGMGAVAQLPLARYTYAAMAESSQRQGLVVEAIEGLETIKTHNASNWAQRKWDRFTAATVDASIRLKDWSSIVVHFSMLVQQMNTVFLVIFGTYLIHAPDPADRITMGALIACVILSGRALAPLSQVAGLMVRLQQARVALEGVNNIVGRKSERDDTRSYLSPGHVRGELRFEAAGYRYRQGEQPGPLVLRGLNIRIAPGEKVALLGRIGSGKSTLLRMAAGLYTAGEGSVLLDGMDMRQVDPADLRAQVSMLGQQPRLFFGTLRENLELGRSDRLASDEELMAALERFGLDKLVRAHPLALNLPVGEDGHGLSGGQRQMVGLTRLTLRDPRVLLLDEPTSGLDERSEHRALQALAQWAGDRTLLVATHRPAVLKLVDRVILLANGRVVMDGPRDAVLRRMNESEPRAGRARGRTVLRRVAAKSPAARARPPVAAEAGGAQGQGAPEMETENVA